MSSIIHPDCPLCRLLLSIPLSIRNRETRYVIKTKGNPLNDIRENSEGVSKLIERLEVSNIKRVPSKQWNPKPRTTTTRLINPGNSFFNKLKISLIFKASRLISLEAIQFVFVVQLHAIRFRIINSSHPEAIHWLHRSCYYVRNRNPLFDFPNYICSLACEIVNCYFNLLLQPTTT